MLMGDVRAEALFRDIDPTVLRSLTAEQEEAIRAAARRDAWGRHPVDVRLSLPLLLGRFYLVLIAGRERRSPARVARERSNHPVSRPANLVALAVILATVGLAVLALVLLAQGAALG